MQIQNLEKKEAMYKKVKLFTKPEELLSGTSVRRHFIQRVMALVQRRNYHSTVPYMPQKEPMY